MRGIVPVLFFLTAGFPFGTIESGRAEPRRYAYKMIGPLADAIALIVFSRAR